MASPLPLHRMVRRARRRLGVTVAAMARVTSYDESAIYYFESGKRRMPDAYIVAIAEISKGLRQELLELRCRECRIGECRMAHVIPFPPPVGAGPDDAADNGRPGRAA